jgi:hypothetical protein
MAVLEGFATSGKVAWDARQILVDPVGQRRNYTFNEYIALITFSAYLQAT